MQSNAVTVKGYIAALPEERKKAITEIRKVILKNLPPGFSETISYGMIGYIVPHNIYPAGYHVDPKLPLPFINVASQKNFIALYHMALYADKPLLSWSTETNWALYLYIRHKIPFRLFWFNPERHYLHWETTQYDSV